MGHIDISFATGDDAFSNEAELSIPALATWIPLPSPLNFRCTIIDIPESRIGTYVIPFKSQNLEKPSGKIETPTEMTVTFRADKYMLVYKILQIWHQAIANNDTGAMAMDAVGVLNSANFRADLQVILRPSNVEAFSELRSYNGWLFRGGWPKSIGGIGFDQSNGEPVTIQVTFSFMKMVPSMFV